MLDILISRLRGEWKKSYIAEKLFRNKKVIDIGSGLGDFLAFDPVHFVGIDINDEVLAISKKRGFTVKKANVAQIPYPDETFDGANCQQVIEHLTPEDAFAMMQEMTRVIKSGGLIVISTEMVTKRFWNTFSHIRPYPPLAIKKLLRPRGQETFEKIDNLTIKRIYYAGAPFKNSLLSLLSTLIAHYLGIGRINYTMILKKK